MKLSLLVQQIALALVLTALALINNVVFSCFFTTEFSNKLNMSVIVFSYLVYLIWQSPIRVGKVTLLVLNTAILFITLYATVQFNTLFLIYLIVIWLTRCVLRQSGLVTGFIDLLLCLVSSSVFYAVFIQGYGLISALWCFLLLQASHGLIPSHKSMSTSQCQATDAFDQALQTAESAMQSLLKKT